MTRAFFAACAFVLGGAIGASGQVGNTPPPPAPCPDCAKAAADAAPIRKAIQEKQAELRQQQQEQGINDANLNNLRQLRQDAARANDQAAAQQHEQSIKDLEADRTANRTEQFNTQQEIEKLNQELEAIGRTVDDCSKQCGARDNSLPTGVVTSGGTEITVGGAPQPPRRVGVPPLRKPPCGDDCEHFGELERAHQELQRRAERANGRGTMQDLRDFEEQRRTVRDLQRKVDDCKKTCQPRTTSFLKPGVIGAAGGVGLIALFAGGDGDRPTAIVNAPVATPNPSPSPAPAPSPTPDPPAPPAPAPRPTADGNYVCVEGTVVSDVDGHEFFIALLRALRNFVVQEGSISIRHAAPFVDIVNAQFNRETGDFLGTAVGRVAGSPTVGVRAQGNVNTSTGRMVFDYTMGTGGELPGGRPVVYRLTLQKQ